MISKRHRSMRFASALVVVATLAAVPVAAQDNKPVSGDAIRAQRIAVVDVDAAMREATAVKSVRAQMKEFSDKYSKEIADEEAALRQADQELLQQRTILSPEVYAQRREEFQQKVAQLQQKAGSLRRAMDQGFNNTMQKIQLVLFEEAAKLARELDYNFVLDRNQVIATIGAFDITEETVKRLNTRLKDVKLKMEEKASDAPADGAAKPSR
jgi:outer membrane protein